MDKQKPTSYSGRFGDAASHSRQTVSGRQASRSADTARRPSGFGTAGQPSRVKPEPEAEPKKTVKLKIKKQKKEKRVRKEREPGKNRPLLRIFLLIVAVILILSALMVLIFGGEDTTYHQMPTIERENTAEFEPEETLLPGLEDL